MKYFVFTKETAKSGRMGGRKLTFTVYEIVNNEVESCGYFEVNSASYKGDQSAVMNYLANAGKLPAEYKGGYYQYQNGNFKITGL